MNITITVFTMDADTERVIGTATSEVATNAQAFEAARDFSDFVTDFAEIITVGMDDGEVWVEVAP